MRLIEFEEEVRDRLGSWSIICLSTVQGLFTNCHMIYCYGGVVLNDDAIFDCDDLNRGHGFDEND